MPRREGRVICLQGRYKAILVEKDVYALELSRYIHLNPVRAGILKNPIQYPWSSYSSYCIKKSKWDWLERGFILTQISKKLGRAIRGYRDYVQRGMTEKQEDPLRKVVASTVIGSEEFTEWVREKWIKQGVGREVPALRAIGKRPDISFATVKSFMKKTASIPKQEKRERLTWLELELRRGSAQARKKRGGEGAYKIVQTTQVVDITSIPFEMKAKTRENF